MKIEKGIPIPEAGTGGGQNKWPWKDMEVDDSVYIDAGVDGYSREWHQKIGTAARQYGKKCQKPAWKFTTRREVNGVRVWRIA